MEDNLFKIVAFGLIMFTVVKLIGFVFMSKLMKPTPEQIELARQRNLSDFSQDEDDF